MGNCFNTILNKNLEQPSEQPSTTKLIIEIPNESNESNESNQNNVIAYVK